MRDFSTRRTKKWRREVDTKSDRGRYGKRTTDRSRGQQAEEVEKRQGEDLMEQSEQEMGERVICRT